MRYQSPINDHPQPRSKRNTLRYRPLKSHWQQIISNQSPPESDFIIPGYWYRLARETHALINQQRLTAGRTHSSFKRTLRSHNCLARAGRRGIISISIRVWYEDDERSVLADAPCEIRERRGLSRMSGDSWFMSREPSFQNLSISPPFCPPCFSRWLFFSSMYAIITEVPYLPFSFSFLLSRSIASFNRPLVRIQMALPLTTLFHRPFTRSRS